MATQRVVLNPFNNLSVGVGTQYNLVAAGPGHYTFNILNTGTAEIAISNAATVGMADPASYLLPPNLSVALTVWGPSGLWVAAGAAETISVALIPKQG